MSLPNSFLVNPEDGTINLHYDGLNPAQVEDLIRRLQGNVNLLKMKSTNPIKVLEQSVRLNRTNNTITFQLNWNAPEMVIDLDDDDITIPQPNIQLTQEQNVEYVASLTKMITSVK